MDWQVSSMFDLANNRLSYSELLRPKAEYSLDFAVGMTYSLDLEALLGVPVSLGLLDDIDQDNMRSPLYILEAIRKSADRIALFCNAGSITLPNKIQSVYSLLENSVFQIKCEKKGNFHPKIWVIKYSREDGDSYINLLVMSRNLTFDSSIDISASLHGPVGTEESEKNRPLADFLRYFAKDAGKKKAQVLELADDVLKVAAFEVSLPFDDYDFFPIGIPGYSGADIPLFAQKNDLFAVSPFLSDDTIQKLTDFDGARALVTRKSSVTPAVMDRFEHVFVTKEILCDNEYQVRQDVHAKIYYTTTRHGNYLYLGSANASQNAFSRNVECLLRLRYKLWQMGYKKFYQDFIPAEICPYEELTAAPAIQLEDNRKKEIHKALREAVYALKRASVAEDSGRYTIRVDAKPLKTHEPVMIAPLQRKDLLCTLTDNVVFSGILLKELSEFYILALDEQKIVVKIRTYGIPKERDLEIYRNIIDSNAKFLNYLSFMLSGDLTESGITVDELEESVLQSADQQSNSQAYSAVYEQMLRVVHQNPSRLKSISDMIRRLDPNVVGSEFLKMYQQFEMAAKKVKK